MHEIEMDRKAMRAALAALAAPQAPTVATREAVSDAALGRTLRAAIKCELFEDGLDADLHDLGITTVTEAYMRGRRDLYDECAAPPTDRAREE